MTRLVSLFLMPLRIFGCNYNVDGLTWLLFRLSVTLGFAVVLLYLLIVGRASESVRILAMSIIVLQVGCAFFQIGIFFDNNDIRREKYPTVIRVMMTLAGVLFGAFVILLARFFYLG